VSLESAHYCNVKLGGGRSLGKSTSVPYSRRTFIVSALEGFRLIGVHRRSSAANLAFSDMPPQHGDATNLSHKPRANPVEIPKATRIPPNPPKGTSISLCSKNTYRKSGFILCSFVQKIKHPTALPSMPKPPPSISYTVHVMVVPAHPRMNRPRKSRNFGTPPSRYPRPSACICGQPAVPPRKAPQRAKPPPAQ
jgi:hypothetical protein